MVWRIRTVTLVALVTAAATAHGYPTPVDFSGTISRWDINRDSSPVTYEILSDSNDPEEYAAVVAAAAKLWSSIPSSYLQIKRASDADTAQISIHLDGGLDNAPYAAGYAEFDDYNNDGAPLHCSIHVDIGQASIDKTILHEMGHCVGLGHSLIPEAIMSYHDDKNRFRVDTDDAAAVSRLYPKASGQHKLPPGCAVAEPMGASGTVQLVQLLLLLIAPAISIFRHIRSRSGY